MTPPILLCMKLLRQYLGSTIGSYYVSGRGTSGTTILCELAEDSQSSERLQASSSSLAPCARRCGPWSAHPHGVLQEVLLHLLLFAKRHWRLPRLRQRHLRHNHSVRAHPVLPPSSSGSKSSVVVAARVLSSLAPLVSSPSCCLAGCSSPLIITGQCGWFTFGNKHTAHQIGNHFRQGFELTIIVVSFNQRTRKRVGGGRATDEKSSSNPFFNRALNQKR